MLRFYLLSSTFTAISLLVYCPAGGEASDDISQAAEQVSAPCEAEESVETDCCCECCCRFCGLKCRSGICARCRAKLAEYGNFNCSCRGSYKFPVPPQFTYHWPGLYSQQMITEYNSPYRFPALKLPQDVAGLGEPEAGLAPGGDKAAPAPGLLPAFVPPPVPEAPSVKIKRKLGIK